MPGPIFFFSYSRQDGGGALDRFYEHLSAAVSRHAGLPSADDAGFRDQASIAMGSAGAGHLRGRF